MVRPVVNAPVKEIDMSKVTRVPERTATPDELAEDRRRCLAAKPRRFDRGEAFESFVEDELRATAGKNGRPELPAVRR
jgi:hypothetical protein